MAKLNITVTAFKPVRRGSLRGFCTAYVREMRLVVRDIAVHEAGSSGARWVALPARPQLDSDGNVRRNSVGKVEYATLMNFDDREVASAFSAAVVRALLEFNPHALDDEAAA